MASSSTHLADLTVDQVVVTAQQMQRIESALFAAGMPVPALMEKVAGRIAAWIAAHYDRDRAPRVGVIAGPGHNGGDALVVARELHHRGYGITLWCPFSKVKALTSDHWRYLALLGLTPQSTPTALLDCDLIVDGGFGIGLMRPLSGDFAAGVDAINQSTVPVISIDVPSGLETDSGQVLGTAVRADHTLCLGLWKLGLVQDVAQPWVGTPHLIPFDIPLPIIQAVVSEAPCFRRITAAIAIAQLPLQRSPLAHKYTVGSLLLIAGSQQYAGAALLAGHGALASGVGMLTLVVPERLKPMVSSQLPEALVVAAPETESGAIANLPPSIALNKYDVVACGPGMTTAAATVFQALLHSDRPLILDADALNWLAHQGPEAIVRSRSAPTLMTPHPGEFKRLFPQVWETTTTASQAAQQAASASNCTVVLKGAVTTIAHLGEQVWFNTDSTPALAKGGSGDVLTGLVAGIAAQTYAQTNLSQGMLSAAVAAVWWHAQTARHLAQRRTVFGCSGRQLADHLLPALAQKLALAHAEAISAPLIGDRDHIR